MTTKSQVLTFIFRPILVATMVLLSAPFESAHAAACSSRDTAIVFGNGVLTTFQGAADSVGSLLTAMQGVFPPSELARMEFSIAYNRSVGFSDFLEAYRMLKGEYHNTLLANEDIVTQLYQYRKRVSEGKKVLLVAHSQGTIFANRVYSFLTPLEKRSFGILDVAAVTDSVAGGGSYVTLTDDVVVNFIRGLLGTPLPGNVTNRTSSQTSSLSICINSGGAICRHSFQGDYLEPNTASRIIILAGVKTALAQLPRPAGCDEIASFQGLGFLPGRPKRSFAVGVSGDGTTVIGGAGGGPLVTFRWRDGRFESLGSGAYLEDINADGSVTIGSFEELSPLSLRVAALRWINGVRSALRGKTPGFNVVGVGTSADGTVVVGNEYKDFETYVLRWDQGRVDRVPGTANFGAQAVSADGTVIVGTSKNGRPGRWIGGKVEALQLFSGAFSARAEDVSGDGTVVVGSAFLNDPLFPSRAFRWEKRRMTSLGTLGPREESQASATNFDGTVVVGQSDSTAFRWTAKTGMQSIQSLLIAAGVNVTGWQITDAEDVSADGTVIVGGGVDPQGHEQGWIAQLPFP